MALSIPLTVTDDTKLCVQYLTVPPYRCMLVRDLRAFLKTYTRASHP